MHRSASAQHVYWTEADASTRARVQQDWERQSPCKLLEQAVGEHLSSHTQAVQCLEPQAVWNLSCDLSQKPGQLSLHHLQHA